MSENVTRLFSLDPAIYNWQEAEESTDIRLQAVERLYIANENFYISPSARSLTVVQSLDHRIKEAIKPVIEDMEILRPNKFNALLNETHSALVNQVEHVDTPAAREALDSLISLLKENSDMTNLFQSYANWLQKA